MSIMFPDHSPDIVEVFVLVTFHQRDIQLTVGLRSRGRCDVSQLTARQSLPLRRQLGGVVGRRQQLDLVLGRRQQLGLVLGRRQQL